MPPKWQPNISPVTGDEVILWICWKCDAYRYSDETIWHHGTEDERKGQVIDALSIKIAVHHGWCPRCD